MKIAVLDDYQDAVRALDCFKLLDGHEVKVFNSTARGLGQLAIRLAPFDALVLIRERTSLSSALLARLPNLKLIAQTGGRPAYRHRTCTRLGRSGRGRGSPVAPANDFMR
jgi:D-3-phosphoglycerate dehydrogenase